MPEIEVNILPNLFIPGAGKSGTSTLHNLLNQHQDICMSEMKEPHFWTHPKFDTLNLDEFTQYNNLFEKGEYKYYGESSTGYMCFPNFFKNIHNYYQQQPKFIFILRNPIDRIYSHYWWLKGMGSERNSLKKAVLNDFDVEPNQQLKLPEGGYKMYYQFGLYAKWIGRFYEEFDTSNILIITTEQLKERRLETLNSCFTFLSLTPLGELTPENTNETALLKFPALYKNVKKLAFNDYHIKKIIKPFFPKKVRTAINEKLHPAIYNLTKTKTQYPTISNYDREWLKDLYQEDVAKLRFITNKPFTEWPDFN